MATLKGQSIAASFQDLVKRADTYSQTGTNIEIMDDSAVVQPTGLYLESGATTDNVGIGTDAPDENLVVSGSGVVSSKIKSTDSADLELIYSNTSRTVTTGLDQSAAAFSICNGTALTAAGAATTLLNLDIGGDSRISLSNNDAGTSNTIFGKSAGASLDAGSNYNVFIGEAVSDDAMNDATNNVGVGYQALSALTTGYDNICIGRDAGAQISTGSSNVCIGKDAGDSLTVEVGLVCIGDDAGQNINAGSNDSDGQIAIGYHSLTALTTGEKNVAIGHNAGKAMTTSDGNTIIGYNAYAAGNNADTTGHNVMIGSGVCDTGTDADIRENVFIGYEVAASVVAHAALKNTGIGKACFANLTSGAENIAIGRNSGSTLSTGSGNIYIGNDNVASAAGALSEIVIGKGVTGSGNNTTTIGRAGVFKFASKSYTCDFCKNDDGDTASSDSTPLKLPAYSIIKSVSVSVITLSDLAEYDVSLVHSSSSGAVSDDAAPAGTPVEILGAGASDTCSGNSASAVDINLAEAGEDGIVNQSYYNAFGGAGLPVGTAARYIHVVNADGNGDSNPSTDGVIKVLVEYVGQE